MRRADVGHEGQGLEQRQSVSVLRYDLALFPAASGSPVADAESMLGRPLWNSRRWGAGSCVHYHYPHCIIPLTDPHWDTAAGWRCWICEDQIPTSYERPSARIWACIPCYEHAETAYEVGRRKSRDLHHLASLARSGVMTKRVGNGSARVTLVAPSNLRRDLDGPLSRGRRHVRPNGRRTRQVLAQERSDAAVKEERRQPRPRGTNAIASPPQCCLAAH